LAFAIFVLNLNQYRSSGRGLTRAGGCNGYVCFGVKVLFVGLWAILSPLAPRPGLLLFLLTGEPLLQK